MRAILLLIAAMALSGCVGVRSATDMRGSVLATGERGTADPEDVRSVFLMRLRRLAEMGTLFEPEVVAPIVGMKLQGSTREVDHASAPCEDGTISSGRVTTVTPSGPSWFHALPSGAGHIEVPAFTINPATTSGDPELQYHIYHSVHCSDWSRLRDHTEANLWFVGLPAFVCLRPSDISSAIPEARSVTATDGVYLLMFQGRMGQDSGTTLSFLFRAGANCALSAQLNQDQEDGLRYRRAAYRYQTCRALSDRDFCVVHAGIAWGDHEMIRKMNEQANNRCGTRNSLYQEEPETGMPPPPPPEHLRRTPCDDSSGRQMAKETGE